MANRVNNWKELLKLANKDLKKYNKVIKLEEIDGSYTLYIEDTADKSFDTYAEGYYEDELGELVNDAWAHARAKIKAK
jgi:hypothetical protein